MANTCSSAAYLRSNSVQKEKKLGSKREATKEGRAFMEDQVLQAAQFLGDMWFSAWQQAPPDKFLIDRLNERK